LCHHFGEDDSIVRQTQDRSQETDVIGNLDMELIAKDTMRAFELFQRELAIAREIGSRFAEKTALNHLGIFFLRAGCHAHGFAWACEGQKSHDEMLVSSRRPALCSHQASHAHAKPWAWHPARLRAHRSSD
jgi:hypothetical protein